MSSLIVMDVTHSMKKCDLVDDVKIDHWYVVCVVHGCHPPNWIFKEIIFRPFHTFGEPTVFIPTKFSENMYCASPPSAKLDFRRKLV